MRFLLITTFFLLTNPTYCQIISLGDPEFKGDIEKVIERSNDHSNYWREYHFDSLSRLIEKISYRNDELLEKVNWNYKDLDSIYIVKKDVNGSLYFHKTYFDSLKRITKYELFSPYDSVLPMITESNIIYADRQIQKLNRIHITQSDTTMVDLYRFFYEKDGSKIVIKQTDNKKISSKTIVFNYDKDGNLKSKLVDYNDPEVVLVGVRWWSRARRDKYRIDYKYDKYGNWIKSYSKTWLRKYKLETRIITYK